MTARELAAGWRRDSADALAPWLGRLLDLGLVQSAGRTKGTRYFVDAGAAARRRGRSVDHAEAHRAASAAGAGARRTCGAIRASKIGEISRPDRGGSSASAAETRVGAIWSRSGGGHHGRTARHGARYQAARETMRAFVWRKRPANQDVSLLSMGQWPRR